MQHPLPSWRSVRFERYAARRAALLIISMSLFHHGLSALRTACPITPFQPNGGVLLSFPDLG